MNSTSDADNSDATDATQWTLAKAQEAVDQWISQWEEGYWPPLSNLARLTEEVGELAREINQSHGDKPGKSGKSDKSSKSDATADAQRIADELGDVLFVVVTLANSLDVDLNQALQDVLHKYGVRDAQRFTPVSDEQ